MGGLVSRNIMVSEDVKIFVDTLISQKAVVVFSKTYCPYCTKAKNVLAKYALDNNKVEIIELEKRPDCSEIQSYLRDLTGASSVPRVFIGGRCIGGGDDTAAADANGQLLPLLRQASALKE